MSDDERWLSWNPERRRVWTEHPCFPKGAIKYRDDSREWRERAYGIDRVMPLRIYRITEDGGTITEVPPEEWDDYA